jgi:hypothetical protein
VNASILACRTALLRFSLLTLSMLVSLPTARAEQSAELPHTNLAQDKPARFSLGAGLGVGLVGEAGLGGLGALGAAGLAGLGAAQGRTPFGASLIELLLSPQLRLVLGAVGSYNKTTESEDKLELGTANSAWSVGGTFGLRWVLNPGATVEISPLLSLGASKAVAKRQRVGSYANEGGIQEYILQNAKAWGYDARLGLVLEYALLTNLYLRLEGYFARAGYTKTATSRFDPRAENTHSQRSDLGLSFGFAPVLQLRLTF